MNKRLDFFFLGFATASGLLIGIITIKFSILGIIPLSMGAFALGVGIEAARNDDGK